MRAPPRARLISRTPPRCLVGVESCCAVAVTSMVAAVIMRTFVLATMLASASSFAPAPKTQLAMRRPPPTPPRVMPPVMIPHSPLHCVGFPGFPSQGSKNWEIAMVCLVPTPHGPACTSPLDSRAPEATALAPGASLEPLASGAPRLWSLPLPCAPSPTQPTPSSTASAPAQAKERRARERYLSVCMLTGFAFTTFVLAIAS